MRRITDEQLEQLPAELNAVVIHDREIEAIKASALPDFVRYRMLKEIRADWRKSAQTRWGHSSRGDGPGGRA